MEGLSAWAAVWRARGKDEQENLRQVGDDLDIEQIRRTPVLNGLINEYTHAV